MTEPYDIERDRLAIDAAWDDRPLDEDLSGRIERLENLLGLLRDYRAREGLRLTDSVDRLGFNATALSEALHQVDRNQQTLTKLGKELDDTKRIVVPREEHVARDAQRRVEAAMYRRRVLHRIYGAAVVVVAIMAGLTVAGLTYLDQTRQRAYEVCTRNNASSASTSAYLRAVTDTSTNAALRTAADQALQGFRSSNCEALR